MRTDSLIQNPKIERRALISRGVDFWLLGGLSILALFYVASGQIKFFYLILAAPFFQLLIEFPHLIVSYKLAYSRERAWIFKHSFRLILFPVLLLTFVAASIFVPQLVPEPTWGVAIGLVFVLIGWHRARQAYGCMRLYSRFDGYELSAFDFKILTILMHAIWIASYLNIMIYARPMSVYGHTVPHLDFPPILASIANFFLMLCLAAFIVVVGRKMILEGRRPSANFLVPFVSLFVWSNSYLFSLDYFIYMTPTFHSLQHLTCVCGYRERNWNWLRMGALLLLSILIGYVVMRTVPLQIATRFGRSALGVYIFVSLHHFLIDSVVWKTSDPITAERLFEIQGEMVLGAQA